MDKIEEMRKKLISAAKKKVQEKYEARDVHIIKSVNLLGDLDGTANLLTEQLREWYAVHFPELGSQVPDNTQYLKMVHYIGKKSNFTGEKISQYLEDKERVGEIVNAVNPLAAIITGGDKKLQSDFGGYFTNAADTGADAQQKFDNAKAIVGQF